MLQKNITFVVCMTHTNEMNYFTFISSQKVLAEHHLKVQLHRDRSGLEQADTFFDIRWMFTHFMVYK